MNPDAAMTKFVICIANEGYEASLERGKIYQVLTDSQASEHELLRVIDESGEDYLFPRGLFVAVDLPDAAIEALSTH